MALIFGVGPFGAGGFGGVATGTTADFNLTRNELIELALSIIGVSEPANDDYGLAVKVLNSMIRHLDAQGTWLWAINPVETTLTLIASQQEYTTGATANNIASDILELEYAAILINSTDREELVLLDKHGVMRTPLKDDTNAQPLACHLNRATLRSNNTLLFYPTPNSSYTVVYNYRRPLYDFDLSTDNPDLPSDWFLPLQKMLAFELSSHYGKPFQERQLLQAEAEKAFRESEALNADEPSYQPLKTEFF